MPTGTELRGLRVLSFESRRAIEMARLVERYGGTCIMAPCMKEDRVGATADVLAFGAALASREIDVALFLTGGGVRVLADVLDATVPRSRWSELLAGVTVAARGPKAAGALRELGVREFLTASDPFLSAELVDVTAAARPLDGARVWLQEYGAPNVALAEAFRARGALVRTVTPYVWKLPDDLGPLSEALLCLEAGNVDVTLFLSAPEIDHLLEYARQTDREESLRAGLARTVVAAVGPSCRARLVERGVRVDIVPESSKMGPLVQAVAARAHTLLLERRR